MVSGFRDSCGDGGGLSIWTSARPLSWCSSPTLLLVRLLPPSFDLTLALLLLLSTLPLANSTAPSSSALPPSSISPPPTFPFPTATSPDSEGVEGGPAADGRIRSARCSRSSAERVRGDTDAKRPDDAEAGVEAGAGAGFNKYACVPTPCPTPSSTGVWNCVPGTLAESDSESECDCCGIYNPRPRPGTVGKGVRGRSGDDLLRSGAGGGDLEDWEPKGRRGDGGPRPRDASDFGDEARDECTRLLHEPEPEAEPSLFCTTTTGNEELPSRWSCCPGSVSVVIAVRRLVLACMGGANGSSRAATTKPCSGLLAAETDDDDADDADGDGGWTGGVEVRSRGRHDPALRGP
jgi:hypothetical protein